MRLFVPLTVLLAAGAIPPAAAEQLYRWKDADGVTNYAEHPPRDAAFETRDIDQDPRRASVAEIAVAAGQPLDATEQCKRARANLQVFERGGVISMDLDGDGTAEPLDSAAIERERVRMQAYIDERCSTA